MDIIFLIHSIFESLKNEKRLRTMVTRRSTTLWGQREVTWFYEYGKNTFPIRRCVPLRDTSFPLKQRNYAEFRLRKSKSGITRNTYNSVNFTVTHCQPFFSTHTYYSSKKIESPVKNWPQRRFDLLNGKKYINLQF